MKKLITFILLISYSAISRGQQIPITSQYMTNRLVINPAYAGELGFYSASISYRKQWVGLEGAPSTQNFSIHGPALKGKLGLGLIAFRDIIGVSRENNVSFSFAYKIKSGNEKSLSFGIAGSAVFSNNEWSQITTTDINDESFSTNSPQYIFPDFSAGIYYNTKKYFIGFSAPMFLTHQFSASSPDYSIRNDFSEYNYLAEVGLKIKLNKILVKPSVLSRYLPNSSFQMDLNCTLDINNIIGLGISYRTQSAIVGILQFHATDQLIVGYSYDHNMSELQPYNNGSHEMFIRYDFRYKVKAFDPRFF